MELSSRPRHQIRAQGRRRGDAGIVIVKNDTSRLRWHPGGNQPVSLGSSVAMKTEKPTGSLELLEFLSRTAVQSSKELLANLDEPVVEPKFDASEGAGSLNEFRRIIANVQKSDRAAFRQIRTQTVVEEARTVPAPGASDAAQPGDSSTSTVESVEEAFYEPVFNEGEQSGTALRGLLSELNEWLSAGLAPSRNRVMPQADQASQTVTTNLRAAETPVQPTAQTGQNESRLDVPQSQVTSALSQFQKQSQSRFGFEQSRDWNYGASLKIAQEGHSERVRSKLSPLLEAARRMIVSVKNLPLGRRIESHENGAILEKDELGRVTQIRAQSGEIISVYYGRDGAPEGFVRTDARGVLHSVAECDAQGVVLRDENGRVRAAGDSLAIDPLGRISICRSDGQYWSIDLARQMLSEKRRLADPSGKWTALTAVFAADGFRMMTLFQKLTPTVGKASVRSQDDANRIWSRAGVESGHFRFYGRDGSTIEFTSEEGLVRLTPTHVSSPGVRPIEPRWHARHQAGTAWQSVHEYVVSYLAI